MLPASDLAHFHADGYFLWRGALDAAALSAELDAALRDGTRAPCEVEVGGGQIQFRYLPMMSERTPVSLALLDRFAIVAAALFDAPVLPVRAKGVEYRTTAAWHRDATGPVRSVGFAAYLEPLRADSGALRVIPGSHRPPFADAGSDETAQVLETDPGDVIVFDEHLLHASAQRGPVGVSRRQWRVDFVADTGDDAALRAYYAALFPPDWNGGYDVAQFPSYGAHWLASGRRWVARMASLGVYEAAARHESRCPPASALSSPA